MIDINKLFRKRIGFPEEEKLTFETLDFVLEKTAMTIPFENLCLLNKNVRVIMIDPLIMDI
jgi:N-hydroxyarylamine O-acetyltransferase